MRFLDSFSILLRFIPIYDESSKKGNLSGGYLGIKRAPGDRPFLPPFKEEKFREIHFIRDVKTRVLTTARRLLLLLRVVF